MIRWDKDKNELRIYSQTAAHWRTIARNLGLEEVTPYCIENISRMKFNDNNECVREVFGKWLENAVGLPNAERYILRAGKACIPYWLIVVLEKLPLNFTQLSQQ